MYFNDVHIAFYVIVAIIGLFVGIAIDWANKRLPEYKKFFSLDFFREKKKVIKPNYVLMIITATIYIGLLYRFGIKETNAITIIFDNPKYNPNAPISFTSPNPIASLPYTSPPSNVIARNIPAPANIPSNIFIDIATSDNP